MTRLKAAPVLLLLACCLLLFSSPGCKRKPKPQDSLASPLFTGKEPKRKVALILPLRAKPGFTPVEREIYATASQLNQAKQLLQALMAGPEPKGQESVALPCFGPEAVYNELYLDGKGLAVLDLPAATVAALPGGTSAEVQTLYCVLRTLNQAFQVNRLQLLIDGQVPATLRGHMDLQDPLALSDF